MAEPLPAVAVIGGGFSGLLVTLQLIRQAERPLSIHLIEPGQPGEGLAYGTRDPEHLLNVRADRMGAIAGEPEHFLRWAMSDEAQAARAALQEGQPLAPEHFMPRRFYAAYLRGLWQEALSLAGRKGIALRHHATVVTRLLPEKDGLTLTLGEGSAWSAQAAVLAIGNLEPPQAVRQFRGLPDGSPFILPSAWEKTAETALRPAVDALGKDATIFILGTGLTMVDTVLSLDRLGYRGRIVALSRNGRLPLPHAAQGNVAWEGGAGSLPNLMRRLKRSIAQHGDWRGVIDGLRPLTVQLWIGLDSREKKRFFSRLFTLWNIHRHRMAPQIHRRMQQKIDDGSLRIRAGKLGLLREEKGRLAIDCHTKQGDETFTADRVIACIGPGYDVERNPHPLLKTLLAEGIVEPHPLHAGLSANGYHLCGRAEDRLFGLGTVLLAERLETTAVPELREQAVEVAAEVLKGIDDRRIGTNPLHSSS